MNSFNYLSEELKSMIVIPEIINGELEFATIVHLNKSKFPLDKIIEMLIKIAGFIENAEDSAWITVTAKDETFHCSSNTDLMPGEPISNDIEKDKEHGLYSLIKSGIE